MVSASRRTAGSRSSSISKRYQQLRNGRQLPAVFILWRGNTGVFATCASYGDSCQLNGRATQFEKARVGSSPVEPARPLFISPVGGRDFRRYAPKALSRRAAPDGGVSIRSHFSSLLPVLDRSFGSGGPHPPQPHSAMHHMATLRQSTSPYGRSEEPVLLLEPEAIAL